MGPKFFQILALYFNAEIQEGILCMEKGMERKPWKLGGLDNSELPTTGDC